MEATLVGKKLVCGKSMVSIMRNAEGEYVMVEKDDQISAGSMYEQILMFFPDHRNEQPFYVARQAGRDLLVYGLQVMASFERVERLLVSEGELVCIARQEDQQVVWCSGHIYEYPLDFHICELRIVERKPLFVARVGAQPMEDVPAGKEFLVYGTETAHAYRDRIFWDTVIFRAEENTIEHFGLEDGQVCMDTLDL